MDELMRDMIKHSDSTNPDEIDRIERELEDWGLEGDYDMVWAWKEYQDKHVLPFAGGTLEQPPVVRRAFSKLNKVFNYHYYTRNRFRPPQQADIPNPFSSLFTVESQE